MTPEQRHFIDSATMDDLLRVWRFAPVGTDPDYLSEVGKRLFDMRDKDIFAFSQASKRVGW